MRDYALLDDWHRKRYLVLPGITGLWQISGRSNLHFDDMVRLDFYYLEHWSVWMDIAILARTAGASWSAAAAPTELPYGAWSSPWRRQRRAGAPRRRRP